MRAWQTSGGQPRGGGMCDQLAEGFARGERILWPAGYDDSFAPDVARPFAEGFDALMLTTCAHLAHITDFVDAPTVAARLRNFDAAHARITLAWPLPLIVGDRMLLRDPRADMHFGQSEVLVAAKHLVNGTTIRPAPRSRSSSTVT